MGICASKDLMELYEHRELKNEDEIPFESASADSFIGQGSFGVVDAVKPSQRHKHHFKDLKFARKTITLDDVDEETLPAAKRSLANEAKTLAAARHEHVVQLIMTYFYPRKNGFRFAFVMSLADGHLGQYLKGRPTPTLKQVTQWSGCLASALFHIHRVGIRHRDIKPTNILLKGGSVLLADFGISKMGLGKTIRTTEDKARARTKDYCAPEVDEGSTRGRSADIFSLGAVFFEMVIAATAPRRLSNLATTLASSDGKSYAKNIEKIHEMIEELISQSQADSWERTTLSLCKRMMDQDRAKRPRQLDGQGGFTSVCTCGHSGGGIPSNDEELIKACGEGSMTAVRSLLSKGANPSTAGAIHQASANGHKNIVLALLESHALIDCQDVGGQTALQYAAAYGHSDIVQVLLESGADVMIEDDEAKTALSCAEFNGVEEIIRPLQERVMAAQSEQRA